MKRMNAGEKFFNSIFDFGGVLAGYVLQTLAIIFLIILQFAIWLNLSGVLCIAAYLAEVCLYVVYLTFLSRPVSFKKEFDRLERMEGKPSADELEFRERLKRLDE